MAEKLKVIQLVSHVVPGMDNASGPVAALAVLCDDGTMWLGDGSGYWQEVYPPGDYATRLEACRNEVSELFSSRVEKEERIVALGDALKRIVDGEDDPREIAHDALYGHLEPNGAIIDGIER